MIAVNVHKCLCTAMDGLNEQFVRKNIDVNLPFTFAFVH